MTTAYTPPAMTVSQIFQAANSNTITPLYGCVIAPQYNLHRYGVTAEEALLGAYDTANGNSYNAWPEKATADTVDVPTSKLYVRDAWLKYLTVSAAGGGSDGLLTNAGNKLRFANTILRSENGYTRNAAFYSRDVAVGDVIKVTKAGGTNIFTKIIGFQTDTIVAATGATAAGAANAVSDTASADVTESISDSDISLVASAAAYNGLASGNITESYECTVTATDGSLTGTTISIVSASGTDDVSSKVLAAGAVACGTRGATMTFTMGSGTFTLGDSWTIDVAMTFTAYVPTASGTYTGRQDTTYLLTVVTGGTVGTDTPRLRVQTTTGYDSGTDIRLTAAGTYTVGNYGVQLAITDAKQFVTGDVYTIAVTAAKVGATKTVITADFLTGFLASDALTIDFCIEDDIELSTNNWAASTNLISVNPGALVVDSTYLGTETVFTLVAGDLYIDYRALTPTNAATPIFVSSRDEIELIAGPIYKTNPAACMLDAMLAESGVKGVGAYFISVTADTAAGYETAYSKLEAVIDVYGLVPYNTSADADVKLRAHVNAMAANNVALFRKGYVGIYTPGVYAVYGSASTILATVASNVLTCSTASFVDQGVSIGDIVRINYQTDSRGAQSYDEFIVSAVNSQTTLTLEGTPSDISVAIKFEVWRNATDVQYADALVAKAAEFNNRRYSLIWADNPGMGTDFLNGDYTNGDAQLYAAIAAAAAAGKRAAIEPHAPLTNVNFLELGMVPLKNFSPSILNRIAAGGVWIITKDLAGNVYTRHQLSSDMTDLYTREDSKTTNVDHIIRDFKIPLAALYGKGNVSNGMLELIRIKIHGITSKISNRLYPVELGPQIVDLQITKLAKDPTSADQIWLKISMETPNPLNKLDVEFRII